jgi:hypothetical protein
MYRKRLRVSFDIDLEMIETSESSIQEELENFKEQASVNPSLKDTPISEIRDLKDRQMRLLRALLKNPEKLEGYIRGEVHDYLADHLKGKSWHEITRLFSKPPLDIRQFLQPVIAQLSQEDQAFYDGLPEDLVNENLTEFHQALQINFSPFVLTELP